MVAIIVLLVIGLLFSMIRCHETKMHLEEVESQRDYAEDKLKKFKALHIAEELEI